MLRFLPCISLFFLLLSAGSAYAQTNNDGIHYGAIETYKYWAGEAPPANHKVLNGQYWSSGHWTKEYILYMELIVPPDMAGYFVTDNQLKAIDTEQSIPTNAPKWFKPPARFKVWSGKQGSLYFIDVKTGHMFMYEVHL